MLGCALAVAPVPALADVGDGSIVPELVSSPHPAPGVTAAVLPGPVPGILLDATSTRETITVFGADGEPYVRLGPRGAEVNARGSDAVLAADAARPRDPNATPRWRRISDRARYAWLESRARYPPEQVTDEVVAAGRRRVLSTWRIPLEVAGRRTELRGITSWIPSAQAAERGDTDGVLGAFGVPIAVLAALTVVAVAVLIAFGRSRGGGAGGRPRTERH